MEQNLTTKIWILPLEPLEQRYSIQWNKQFKEVFDKEGVDYEFIEGDMVDSKLEGKFFLDPIQTNIWKFSQLERLLKRSNEIKDEDIVFLFDGWFPGVEALKYTFTFLGKQTKLMSYFHAGTYDKFDLTNQLGMEKWGKNLENSWFEIYDKIFVATQSHKDMITSSRKIKEDKLKVVGFPLDVEGIREKYKGSKKENLIAFTGRKSIEKGYDDVLKLQQQGFPVVITLNETKTKDEYYELLSRCKYVLSTANQETFGIGIVEGMTLGCIPIVPNRLSYRETVVGYCRNEDIVSNFGSILEDMKDVREEDLYNLASRYQYQNVIENILRELK